MSTPNADPAADVVLPALRPVDVTQTPGDDGEMRFVLHDRMGIATQAIAISVAGYVVLAHLDGKNTIADVQAGFLQHTGMHVRAEQVLDVVASLDAALFLEGERFEAAYAERRAAYLAAPTRDNRSRYPDAESLRADLTRIIESGTKQDVGAVRGLIAPHLDSARGAPCYGDAYATLATVPRDARFVILGTNHGGRNQTVVATKKAFETPLGVVPVDVEFIDRLTAASGLDLCGDAFDHNLEHSVELQVHMLQTLAGETPFEIVPVLCGSPICMDGQAETRPSMDAFGDALRDLVSEADRPTVIIAGADLSHVGQSFGDSEAITPAKLEEVAAADRAVLDAIERRDDTAWIAQLEANDNPTRICSVGCLYVLLRALPNCTCRVLGYHQAIDHETDTHVTCAAVALTE